MMNLNQFVQADSRNLPEVNMAMVLEYFQTSDKHNIAEIRGVKTLLTSRSSYVENAVGYVDLKRENTNCIVRARVVPEHKVTKRYYVVSAELDESQNTIINTECEGCPASQGGCKHSIVLLFWLEKKWSEPSTTEIRCYWKKPKLSIEATKPAQVKEIASTASSLSPRDPSKLNKFYEECEKRKIKNALILMVLPNYDRGLSKYCIFDLLIEFTSHSDNHSFENFKDSMTVVLTNNIVEQIEKSTTEQSESKLWHSLHQGRITGAKIYNVCHCQTPDGSLVEQILGGYKYYESKAMKRGKMLEKPVVREIEKKPNCTIRECGFSLINLICGASPDGVADDFIVEVKCPSRKEVVKNYIDNNKVTQKFYDQCQFEMLATGYQKCAFCVADPSFENSKIVHLVWIYFDSAYANNLLDKAEHFWKTTIYPKILKSVLS